MSQERPTPEDLHYKCTDEDLQREILAGRKFTLAEAIARLAGPGMMKGVSPIARQQQAAAALETFLDRHLQSPAGALSIVLLRRAKESALLLANPDEPLTVLASILQQILDSEHRLQELVRESDVEWGRVYDERPFFQKEGCPPHEDDPYTCESVRGSLVALLEVLAASHASQ